MVMKDHGFGAERRRVRTAAFRRFFATTPLIMKEIQHRFWL
ncbi:Hypothetical protein SMB2099_2418 [Serratia marcescens SMB2099]|nr:Hypothetical protein SMB2099_2418 [Serratia marcescens SMB2099]